MKYLVHLVLDPHEIAPTFLNFDSWSPGAGFIPIISTNELNQINKKILRKKIKMHRKRFAIFFKRWMLFHLGAILRIPKYSNVAIFIFKPNESLPYRYPTLPS